jgi:hypothetical protein
VPAEGLGPLFRWLADRGRNVIVECEDLDDEDAQDFFIGKITAVRDGSLSLLHFDVKGCWEKSASKVYFDDVTLVRFDSPYVEVFSKYVR